MRQVLFVLCLVVLTACADSQNVPALDGPAPMDIENFAGTDALASATAAMRTSVAIRMTVTAAAEAKTATQQAATAMVEGTKQTDIRQATATANAIWARQQQMSTDATAAALSAQSEQTQQASNATATAQALDFAASRTTAAQQATATQQAATATRGAQEIQAAHEKQEATATAQAVQLHIAQAQEDAARSQRWNDFFDTILKLILGIGSLAVSVLLIVQLARYLNAIALRQNILETRAGTVMIVSLGRGQYAPQLIQAVPNLIESGDDFETQAPTVENEAPELLKVTTARGATFIAKSDPEDEAREAQRKLVLRLMRESMRHYSAQGIDPRTETRIPTFRNLGWSSETWVRAIASLKPHVITKQGRGGGTFCSAQFPSLMALYSAVGERRITLTSTQTPSLTVEGLAA